jgi:hypothetical protein
MIKLRGQRGEALNRFWAGETDAAHALAEMRGFRCEISVEAREPKACEFCGGTGVMEVAACTHGMHRGDRTRCTPACLRPETCAGCLGSGVEKTGVTR